MENEAILQNTDNLTNDVGDNDEGEPDGDNDDKSPVFIENPFWKKKYFKNWKTVLRK